MQKFLLISMVLCLIATGVILRSKVWSKQNVDNRIFLSLPYQPGPVSIDQNGQIVVKVFPCETVTPVADYRDLLGTGYFYGGIHAIEGHPPFIATLVCCSTPVPPVQV